MEGTRQQERREEHISSPEQLDRYLNVTTPAMWVVLAAVLLFLTGMIIWGVVTSVESRAQVQVAAKSGILYVSFPETSLPDKAGEGMVLRVAGRETPILDFQKDSGGPAVAVAREELPDGVYPGEVVYWRQTLVELLLK